MLEIEIWTGSAMPVTEPFPVTKKGPVGLDSETATFFGQGKAVSCRVSVTPFSTDLK